MHDQSHKMSNWSNDKAIDIPVKKKWIMFSEFFSRNRKYWIELNYSPHEATWKARYLFQYKFNTYTIKILLGRNNLIYKNLHLNVSASKTWQLAWCSNWSSSQRKLWQKEQLNILPPVKLQNKTHKCKYDKLQFKKLLSVNLLR